MINNSSQEPPHSGAWDAWLDGFGTTHTDTATQTVTIPSTATTATLSFFLHIDTAETTTTTAFDKLQVQVLNTSGAVLATLGTFSNLNHATGYQQHSFSVIQFKGQTVTYVDRKAFSAGAFIAVATQKIYMAPESVIGAAAPLMMMPGTGSVHGTLLGVAAIAVLKNGLACLPVVMRMNAAEEMSGLLTGALLLLALTGSALGLAIAFGGVRMLTALAARYSPRIPAGSSTVSPVLVVRVSRP